MSDVVFDLANELNADAITALSDYVAGFVSVGFLLGLMLWVVGYVVNYIQMIMRGGY